MNYTPSNLGTSHYGYAPIPSGAVPHVQYEYTTSAGSPARIVETTTAPTTHLAATGTSPNPSPHRISPLRPAVAVGGYRSPHPHNGAQYSPPNRARNNSSNNNSPNSPRRQHRVQINGATLSSTVTVLQFVQRATGINPRVVESTNSGVSVGFNSPEDEIQAITRLLDKNSKQELWVDNIRCTILVDGEEIAPGSPPRRAVSPHGPAHRRSSGSIPVGIQGISTEGVPVIDIPIERLRVSPLQQPHGSPVFRNFRADRNPAPTNATLQQAVPELNTPHSTTSYSMSSTASTPPVSPTTAVSSTASVSSSLQPLSSHTSSHDEVKPQQPPTTQSSAVKTRRRLVPETGASYTPASLMFEEFHTDVHTDATTSLPPRNSDDREIVDPVTITEPPLMPSQFTPHSTSPSPPKSKLTPTFHDTGSSYISVSNTSPMMVGLDVTGNGRFGNSPARSPSYTQDPLLQHYYHSISRSPSTSPMRERVYPSSSSPVNSPVPQIPTQIVRTSPYKQDYAGHHRVGSGGRSPFRARQPPAEQVADAERLLKERELNAFKSPEDEVAKQAKIAQQHEEMRRRVLQMERQTELSEERVKHLQAAKKLAEELRDKEFERKNFAYSNRIQVGVMEAEKEIMESEERDKQRKLQLELEKKRRAEERKKLQEEAEQLRLEYQREVEELEKGKEKIRQARMEAEQLAQQREIVEAQNREARRMREDDMEDAKRRLDHAKFDAIQKQKEEELQTERTKLAKMQEEVRNYEEDRKKHDEQRTAQLQAAEHKAAEEEKKRMKEEAQRKQWEQEREQERRREKEREQELRQMREKMYQQEEARRRDEMEREKQREIERKKEAQVRLQKEHLLQQQIKEQQLREERMMQQQRELQQQLELERRLKLEQEKENARIIEEARILQQQAEKARKRPVSPVANTHTTMQNVQQKWKQEVERRNMLELERRKILAASQNSRAQKVAPLAAAPDNQRYSLPQPHSRPFTLPPPPHPPSPQELLQLDTQTTGGSATVLTHEQVSLPSTLEADADTVVANTPPHPHPHIHVQQPTVERLPESTTISSTGEFHTSHLPPVPPSSKPAPQISGIGGPPPPPPLSPLRSDTVTDSESSTLQDTRYGRMEHFTETATKEPASTFAAPPMTPMEMAAAAARAQQDAETWPRPPPMTPMEIAAAAAAAEQRNSMRPPPRTPMEIAAAEAQAEALRQQQTMYPPPRTPMEIAAAEAQAEALAEQHKRLGASAPNNPPTPSFGDGPPPVIPMPKMKPRPANVPKKMKAKDFDNETAAQYLRWGLVAFLLLIIPFFIGTKHTTHSAVVNTPTSTHRAKRSTTYDGHSGSCSPGWSESNLSADAIITCTVPTHAMCIYFPYYTDVALQQIQEGKALCGKDKRCNYGTYVDSSSYNFSLGWQFVQSHGTLSHGQPQLNVTMQGCGSSKDSKDTHTAVLSLSYNISHPVNVSVITFSKHTSVPLNVANILNSKSHVLSWSPFIDYNETEEQHEEKKEMLGQQHQATISKDGWTVIIADMLSLFLRSPLKYFVEKRRTTSQQGHLIVGVTVVDGDGMNKTVAQELIADRTEGLPAVVLPVSVANGREMFTRDYVLQLQKLVLNGYTSRKPL